MSGTGKHINVLRRSPTQQQQQNGSYSGGKVTKTPQSRGTKSSKVVLAPMNGELGKAEEARLSGMRGRSSSFGKEEMNLMAVRKVDPNVAEILSTVSQVMLYQYDQTSGEWERTSIEGTLFICNRSGVSPRYGFMILNRLSNDNMLEEIVPNMEFRVQNPFVLFKKNTGNIFGLCFQEESTCQETGQLLNSLGSQENHLPVVGRSSPRSRRNPSLNASMRSTSAPAFKQTTTSAAANGKPYLVDVLENGNYTSSEGENTSSPDSLTSDPISFVAAAAPPTSSTHPAGAILIHHNKHKSRDKATSPVSQKQNSKSSTPGKKSMQSSSSSSRNIPSSKGGSEQGQRSQQLSSGSVSPSKGRSRSPKQQRQQQNGSATGGGGGGGSGRVRGEMRHAASFDHGFMSGTSPLRSFTAPTTHHHPQQQAHQHDFFSPQQLPHHQSQQVVVVQPSSVFERLAAEVSGQQQQQQQPVVDKTVRRLFTADTSHDVVTSHSGGSVPTSLQSIFSQVSASTANSTTTDSTNPPLGATTGGGGDVLPLTVISLEQVEKQIVADVPSPISINPLTLFSGGSNGSGVSSIAPSLPISTSSSATGAKPSEASQQYRILLQPSAFMPSTVSVTTSIGNPNPSVSSVAISIEPPTPVVAPGPTFANGGDGGSGGTTPSSNLKAQLLPESATPPSAVSSSVAFPPIPPLMHSPGMRAAPVSRVNHHPKQPAQPQPQQQTRGEPSSLVTTTASLVPRGVQPTVTAVSQVGAGKPSRQISSTTEERRPPQATPQRYSSQSTPSLTPLAELSIPRRSTTAPTGLPPSTSTANIVPGGPAGALMSPHQFAHSTSTSAVAEKSSGGQGEEGSKVTTTKGAEPVGLSREQLQQAMLYLIKHDDGFLSKLHEAYHLSLSEKQV